jgi:hypothetical protein
MWLRWRSRGELVSSHHADRIMRPARRPLEGCGPRPARRFGRARAGTRVSRGCRHRDGSVPRCGRRLRLPRGQRSGSRGSEPLGDRLRQQRQADTGGHGEKHVLHAGSGTSTNVGASPALWHIATIALLNAGLTSRGAQRERMGEHLVPGSPIVDGCTHRAHHARRLNTQRHRRRWAQNGVAVVSAQGRTPQLAWRRSSSAARRRANRASCRRSRGRPTSSSAASSCRASGSSAY